jgi:hypothetical protein
MYLSLTTPEVKTSLRSWIRRRPRTTSALAFGTVTLAVTHFAWVADARMNGLVLTFAVGVAHALAGAITGQSLLGGTHPRTPLRAGLLGAATSVLALFLFSPAFAVFIAEKDVAHEGVFSHLMLTMLIGVFSFLAVWWAFVVVSICVGWSLYWASKDSDP